jgi:maltooligosyltrehalose trehalohydrolase
MSGKMGRMSEASQRQGATVTPNGVHYNIWAPSRKEVTIQVCDDRGSLLRAIPLTRDERGYHRGLDSAGRAGDRYLVQLENGTPLPCPASHFQPDGVQGPSG